MDAHKTPEKILDRSGIKPTPNRILVLRELMGAVRPLSLADLEEVLGFTLDKASIFRVLELFSERDIVHVIEDGSRSLKYEVCQSETHHHSIEDEHVHFYCERCRRTFCFEETKVPQVEMPEGYRARSINYMIKGVCAECSSKRDCEGDSGGEKSSGKGNWL